MSAGRATELSRCTVRFIHSAMLAETGNGVSCPGWGHQNDFDPICQSQGLRIAVTFLSQMNTAATDRGLMVGI